MRVSGVDRIRLPDDLKEIGRDAQRLGVTVRVVGGFVRDRLTGAPMSDDIDLYTDSPAGPELARRITARWKGKTEKFPRFGTHRISVD